MSKGILSIGLHVRGYRPPSRLPAFLVGHVCRTSPPQRVRACASLTLPPSPSRCARARRLKCHSLCTLSLLCLVLGQPIMVGSLRRMSRLVLPRVSQFQARVDHHQRAQAKRLWQRCKPNPLSIECNPTRQVLVSVVGVRGGGGWEGAGTGPVCVHLAQLSIGYSCLPPARIRSMCCTPVNLPPPLSSASSPPQ